VRTMLSTSLRAIIAQQLLRRADGTGRIAAHEIMIASTAVANMIREGATEKIPSYIQSGRDQGMILMDTTLKKYLEATLITAEEAFRFAQEKTAFEQYCSHDLKPATGKPEAAEGKAAKKAPVEESKLAKKKPGTDESKPLKKPGTEEREALKNPPVPESKPK